MRKNPALFFFCRGERQTRVTDAKAQGTTGRKKTEVRFFLSRLPLRTNFWRERDVWYEEGREPVKGPTPGYAHKENKDNRDRA